MEKKRLNYTVDHVHAFTRSYVQLLRVNFLICVSDIFISRYLDGVNTVLSQDNMHVVVVFDLYTSSNGRVLSLVFIDS